MNSQSNWILKNIHLIISIIIVIPTAIIYGSKSLLPEFLDIQIHTIDQSNMLKAIMVFYLGASIIWILGIFKSSYWKRATELNILFMLCLFIGRVLSIIFDGLPSYGYIYGAIGELILGVFSIYQLRNYN